MNKLHIKRIGVLSVAKIYALMMALIALIIGVPYGLFVMAFGASMMGRSGAAAGGAFVGGLVVMIAFPIIYGILGFIFGAIGALIYNLLAGALGGIEIEVENVY